VADETRQETAPRPRGTELILRLLGAAVRRAFLSDNFVLYLSLASLLILWPLVPAIVRPYNLGNISSNMWPLLTLVIGQMFVLLVGGIDLSQTSIMALASVVGGAIMTTELDPALFDRSPLWGWLLAEQGGALAGSPAAVPAAIAAMCLVGGAIGLLNGIAVARLRMPPFMATLVSMIFFSGAAIYLTQSENISHLPEAFTAIGQGGVGPIPCSLFLPYSLAVAAALAGGAYFVLIRTILGRWLYAVGTNRTAAAISGVPVERVTITAYVLSGFCAAAGSVLYSARLAGGRPTLGENELLDIIGAAVIGGISLFGGKGTVRCAIFGVFFFTVLDSSLDMLNLKFYTVHIIKGTVILLAAAIDVGRMRLLARAR
jgi:ribose transport system permease protein